MVVFFLYGSYRDVSLSSIPDYITITVIVNITVMTLHIHSIVEWFMTLWTFLSIKNIIIQVVYVTFSNALSWQRVCLNWQLGWHKWLLLLHGPLCQIRKTAGAHAPGIPGTFSPPPRVSDPDMHHDTCVTHVPRCMPGSLTRCFLWSRWWGKTFPAHAQPAILRIW